MLIFYIIFQIVLLLLIIGAAVQLFNLLFRGYAPFISTHKESIDAIANEVKLDKNSVFFELGSGNAAILRALEKRFKEGDLVGIEYAFLPYFLSIFQLLFNKSRVIMLKKNLFKVDLSKASYIYCFLNIEMMMRLEKKLKEECKKGTIVISYIFTFPSLKPYKTLDIDKNKVYFYQI